MQKHFLYFGAAALAAVVLVPGLALAGHGKAGLWQVTVTMGGMTMPQMPDMSQLPPEAQARMKAMQMQMSGHSMSVQHCMTPQEVSMDKPDMSHMMHNKDCSMANVVTSGHTFNADMVCTSGDFQGKGHVQMTFDSDEHYSGSSSMTGTAHGQPIDMKESFDGKWIAADCGSVTH
ncbi:MAG TPA: DUF3617 domain-containing protein [Rhizomicrobium sp.]|jgi:hypothetical protein|nr:DUF3617 domain-containing protein [Rhizomicrobium sp.]